MMNPHHSKSTKRKRDKSKDGTEEIIPMNKSKKTDADDPIKSNDISVKPVIFTIVSKASQKKQDKLFDSQSYSYHLHMTYTDKNGKRLGTYWRCSRINSAKCRVRVFQNFNTQKFNYVNSFSAHTHTGQDYMPSAFYQRDVAKVVTNSESKRIKSTLAKIANIRNRASSLDYDVVNNLSPLTIRKESKSPKTVLKSDNSNCMPLITTISNIQFNADNYPLLQISDLINSNRVRSILVTSNSYMQVLGQRGIWNICLSTGATYHPFKGVVAIQSVCTNSKLTPLVKVTLAVIFLSDVTKDVVKKSLCKLVSLLPRGVTAAKIMVHPDPSIWNAVKEVLPDKALKCNLFAWRRDFDEHIARFDGVDKDWSVIRKLRCLNLIPSDDMPAALQLLRLEAKDCTEDRCYFKLKEVVRYVRSHWIGSDIWQPSDWSTYGEVYFGDGASLFGDHEVQGPLELISLFHKCALKMRSLKAVEDISIIRKTLPAIIENQTIQSIRKYWRKYRRNKLDLESLLTKLSQLP